tara:strand:+ start:2042 stop:2440 length:399 start_codon:yes stop_codon:yes gene_type:complete
MKVVSLYDAYNEWVNILNNINKYHFTEYNVREELEKIECKILEYDKGFELLINLKIINNYRKLLHNKDLTKSQKRFMILKLFESADICESILNIKKNYLLNEEEIVIKNWLKIALFINNLKEHILFCGCNLI